jgi:hypothetical protein
MSAERSRRCSKGAASSKLLELANPTLRAAPGPSKVVVGDRARREGGLRRRAAELIPGQAAVELSAKCSAAGDSVCEHEPTY